MLEYLGTTKVKSAIIELSDYHDILCIVHANRRKVSIIRVLESNFPLIHSISLKQTNIHISCMSWAHGGLIYAIGMSDGSLEIHDTDKGSLLFRIPPPLPDDSVRHISWFSFPALPIHSDSSAELLSVTADSMPPDLAATLHTLSSLYLSPHTHSPQTTHAPVISVSHESGSVVVYVPPLSLLIFHAPFSVFPPPSTLPPWVLISISKLLHSQTWRTVRSAACIAALSSILRREALALCFAWDDARAALTDCLLCTPTATAVSAPPNPPPESPEDASSILCNALLDFLLTGTPHPALVSTLAPSVSECLPAAAFALITQRISTCLLLLEGRVHRLAIAVTALLAALRRRCKGRGRSLPKTNPHTHRPRHNSLPHTHTLHTSSDIPHRARFIPAKIDQKALRVAACAAAKAVLLSGPRVGAALRLAETQSLALLAWLEAALGSAPVRAPGVDPHVIVPVLTSGRLAPCVPALEPPDAPPLPPPPPIRRAVLLDRVTLATTATEDALNMKTHRPYRAWCRTVHRPRVPFPPVPPLARAVLLTASACSRLIRPPNLLLPTPHTASSDKQSDTQHNPMCFRLIPPPLARSITPYLSSRPYDLFLLVTLADNHTPHPLLVTVNWNSPGASGRSSPTHVSGSSASWAPVARLPPFPFEFNHSLCDVSVPSEPPDSVLFVAVCSGLSGSSFLAAWRLSLFAESGTSDGVCCGACDYSDLPFIPGVWSCIGEHRLPDNVTYNKVKLSNRSVVALSGENHISFFLIHPDESHDDTTQISQDNSLVSV